MRFMCAYHAAPTMRKLPLSPGDSGHMPLIWLRSETVFGAHVSASLGSWPGALPTNHVPLFVMLSASPMAFVIRSIVWLNGEAGEPVTMSVNLSIWSGFRSSYVDTAGLNSMTFMGAQ